MSKLNHRNLNARLELLKSPEKLKELGSTIVKNSIARTMLLNSPEAKHDKGVLIKKGEYVPVNLVKLLHIEVDVKGLALKDFQIFSNILQAEGGYDACTWIEAGSWPDSYCECWPDSGDMGLRPDIQVFARDLIKEEIKNVFTDKEIVLLKQYNLIKE